MTTRLSFSYPVTSHKASAFFPFLTVSVLIFLSAPPKCFSGFISLKKKRCCNFGICVCSLLQIHQLQTSGHLKYLLKVKFRNPEWTVGAASEFFDLVLQMCEFFSLSNFVLKYFELNRKDVGGWSHDSNLH